MRLSAAPLMLVLALGLAPEAMAYGPGGQGRWFADIHAQGASLSGHLQGTSGGNPFNVDLKDDLGLERSGYKPGFSLEYQGPRFGLELSRDRQDYTGDTHLSRTITVNGTTYAASTRVLSSLKTTSTTFNWTIRALAGPQAWLGVDLGVRSTELDFATSGSLASTTTAAGYRTTLPMPQVGPAAGFTALDGALVGRAFVHFLAYKGASYTHPGADLRYFPISWLGIRAFYDGERFRVPKGSLKDDMDLSLDLGGAGLGVVARF
jgi:hypothetical protein